MPKISIIMPSFNVAPYIRECMDSVLAQTLSDIEVIVVDADSTDGTREILDEYAQKDSRIVILKDDKKSTGYANNKALDYATGEYIGIVETDDYIDASMFEELYHMAVLKNADVVKADSRYFVNDHGRRAFFESHIFHKEYGDLYNKVINYHEDIRAYPLACKYRVK